MYDLHFQIVSWFIDFYRHVAQKVEEVIFYSCDEKKRRKSAVFSLNGFNLLDTRVLREQSKLFLHVDYKSETERTPVSHLSSSGKIY